MKFLSDKLLFKRYFTLFFSVCVFVLNLCCLKSNTKTSPEISFAVLAHSYGSTPYSGPAEKLPAVISGINKDNPVFVVHLGGFICAGLEWQGIVFSDAERQYKEAFKLLSGLSPILYTVKGEPDLFNGRSGLYRRFSGRNEFYSFNYGPLHFIVLDSMPQSESFQREQKEWLKKELIEYKSFDKPVVFLHDPLFVPDSLKNSDVEICDDYKSLHKIFKDNRIKTVVTGGAPDFFRINVDGVEYVNAGCCGFNETKSAGSYQYYIFTYKNGEIKVLPRSVK